MKRLYYTLAVMVILFIGISCSTTTPLTATNNPIGDKEGTSTNKCFFSPDLSRLPADGGFKPTSFGLCNNTRKYSIIDAAEDGGITKVATVDLKVTDYILWKEFTLIVTGE